ncbi:MAG: HesA/MoeB/ThiF family protein [Methanomicrobium sp.]|nr:HesA/MoeB/ThiF family protein [Methanomicrobium sp.]
MLTGDELTRYKRQIMIFGELGQVKLKEAKIFVAGAGGLGSPVLYYLAAAGVGTIVIADRDTIELSNLNRQILHRTSNIGCDKVLSAKEKLKALNPEVEVLTFKGTIDSSSADKIVGDADGIVDALDNFATRYVLNETALDKNIPLFHGAVRGLHGQATTIIPGKTGCLRCLFPNAAPAEVSPVLGATAAIIGSIQANEVIKYITGRGKLLTNRLFIWDGLDAESTIMPFEKNPRCSLCAGRKIEKAHRIR